MEAVQASRCSGSGGAWEWRKSWPTTSAVEWVRKVGKEAEYQARGRREMGASMSPGAYQADGRMRLLGEQGTLCHSPPYPMWHHLSLFHSVA